MSEQKEEATDFRGQHACTMALDGKLVVYYPHLTNNDE